MRSMKRPSRARFESATTRLKNGRFLAPPRASLITTMVIATLKMRKGRDFTLVFALYARQEPGRAGSHFEPGTAAGRQRKSLIAKGSQATLAIETNACRRATCL